MTDYPITVATPITPDQRAALWQSSVCDILAELIIDDLLQTIPVQLPFSEADDIITEGKDCPPSPPFEEAPHAPRLPVPLR